METELFLRTLLISAIIWVGIVAPIIKLISMKLEKRRDKLNKDIRKMIEDLRREREFIKERVNGRMY